MTFGEVVDAPLRLFQPALTVCMQMVVVTMEWLKRDMGWMLLYWKSLPLDQSTKVVGAWPEEMAMKHAERYPPCTFHFICCIHSGTVSHFLFVIGGGELLLV